MTRADLTQQHHDTVSLLLVNFGPDKLRRRLLQEAGELQARLEQFLEPVFLFVLLFERRREHVWEQTQYKRQRQFETWDDNKYGKREEPKHVDGGASQQTPLAPREPRAVESFAENARRGGYIFPHELEPRPVVLCLVEEDLPCPAARGWKLPWVANVVLDAVEYPYNHLSRSAPRRPHCIGHALAKRLLGLTRLALVLLLLLLEQLLGCERRLVVFTPVPFRGRGHGLV